MNNKLQNLLVLLKSTSVLKREKLVLPYSASYVLLLNFLYKKGLIQSFSVKDKKVFIFLRYFFADSPFKNLKLISKRSYSHNISYKKLCVLNPQKNLIVFSTNAGLMDLLDCKKFKKGGTALFFC
jgi:ribosomal protein S8